MESENGLPSFDEHERDWKRKHKSSLPRKPKVSSAQEYFWILFWVIVATGAAVFSAAHTIPAAEMTLFSNLPGRGQLAITAFIIVELVIFGAAAKRREIQWLIWLLIGSLVVALMGNTSSSIRAVAENGGDILNQIGGVVLSVIAPFTALAAGEVLHIQLDTLAIKRAEAQDTYDTQWKEVETKINQAYTKLVKESKAALPTPVRRLSVQTDTDKQPKHIALEYLKAHTDQTFTVRKLAEEAGVTNDAAHKAMKMFSANGHSQNGNGVH